MECEKMETENRLFHKRAWLESKEGDVWLRKFLKKWMAYEYVYGLGERRL